MRGMVFGEDGQKLIIAATSDEVARFSRGDAVRVDRADYDRERQIAESVYRETIHMLHLEGFDVVRSNRHEHFPSSPTQAVVKLRTKCGCERDIVVPYPPAPTVRVPMYDRAHVGAFYHNERELDVIASSTVTARTFKFDRRTNRNEFYYVEE